MTLTDDLAIQFVYIMLVTLVVMFVLLVGYSVIQRIISKSVKNTLAASESYIQKYLYQYLDSEIDSKQFSEFLRNRYDIVASYHLINPMIDNLKGEERTRLRRLLDIAKYKRHFLKKLRGKKPIEMAHACSYFSQKNEAEAVTERRLKFLQHHEYSVLAYSSTLALLSSDEQVVRDRAIEIFLHRKHNASMAINDVVFKYYRSHIDKEICADYITRISSGSFISLSTAAALIRMYPEFGFLDKADQLLELLKNPHRYDYNGMWTSALIDVLDQFYHPGLQQIIMNRRLCESPFQQVRLSCSKWIANNFSLETKEMGLKLACDSDLEVRYVAQKVLSDHNHDNDILPRLSESQKKEFESITTVRGLDRLTL